ncbi:MAG: hypothetical protein U5K56_06990 [Halioglobus sp.]|nr:hypothetical protein [Halioglobus sp.]
MEKAGSRKSAGGFGILLAPAQQGAPDALAGTLNQSGFTGHGTSSCKSLPASPAITSPRPGCWRASVKQYVPGARFHLLLCDRPPPGFDLSGEDFDELIRLDELPVENRAAWIYQHNVVELCTAVKGLGFLEIFRRSDADRVVFLDPDVVLFSDLDEIDRMLERHSLLLTPHQTEPETSHSADPRQRGQQPQTRRLQSGHSSPSGAAPRACVSSTGGMTGSGTSVTTIAARAFLPIRNGSISHRRFSPIWA